MSTEQGKEYKELSTEQVQHFLNNGWVRIEQAFTAQQAAEWTKTLWARLGMDPEDKTTWRERTHMPWHQRHQVADFAPKAWDAMCDLLGGAERIDAESSAWGDSFIVNLGRPEWEQMYDSAAAQREVRKGEDMMDPAELDNWHVDGDFFVHFLDSPEQALLVIPIFTPIEPLSGGTYICPTGFPLVAKYLASHPEGVVPTGGGFASVNASLLSWGAPLRSEQVPPGMPVNVHDEPTYDSPAPWPPAPHPERFAYGADVARAPGMKFTELTGAVGDVILMHPLMLHSASRNWRRHLRVITNPPVGLRAPFEFDREDKSEYSLVERKTLEALGAWEQGGLRGWCATGERRRIVPRRLMDYGRMQEDEKQRIQATVGLAPVAASVAIKG